MPSARTRQNLKAVIFQFPDIEKYSPKKTSSTKIMQALFESGKVMSVRDLAKLTNQSLNTVRTDVTHLYKGGYLCKMPGSFVCVTEINYKLWLNDALKKAL